MTDNGVAVVPEDVQTVEECVKVSPEISLEHFSICNMEEVDSLLATSPDPPAHVLPTSVAKEDDLLSQLSNTPEPAGGEVISDSQSTFLELEANLRRSEEQCQHLHTQLAEKDMMITTLQRSCSLLDKETALSKRELELAQRDKESAVMRYAIVEKKVIDANMARDGVEKRWKEGQKEVEALNHKLRHMNTEKTRMCQIVEQKVSNVISKEALKNSISF